MKDRIIKRCPKCGGRIVVSHLYQTSHNHTITQKGKLSKGFKRDGEHSMECSIASCIFAPDECDVSWNADDFYIDSKDRFHDLKYGEE